LSLALDGMAAACRQLADMRRMVSVAMIYPLLVALLTIPGGLLLGFTVLPRIRVFHAVAKAPASWEQINSARQAIPAWAPATGGVFALLGIGWWIWSRRLFSLDSGRLAGTPNRRPLGLGAARAGLDRLSWLWLPRMAIGLRRDERLAALAQVLAELIAAGTPLPQALRLAGETTGERDLAAAAGSLAARIEQGSTPGGDDPALHALPRLLIWSLSASPDAAELERTLRHVAATYRASAAQRAEWLRDSLPAMLAVSIGGTAVFTYALWLFLPWFRTLVDISSVTR
jgi:type II secretory pathway component PulF